MRRGKLSNRLAITYSLLFGAAFFVLSAAVLLCMVQLLTATAHGHMAELMPVAVDHIQREATDGHDHKVTDPEMLYELAPDANMNIVLYDESGEILSATANFYMDVARISSEPDAFRSFRQDGMVLMTLARDLDVPGVGVGRVLLVYQFSNELNFTRMLALLLLAANAIGAVVAGFVARYMSRRMLSPIDRIIHETRRITSKNLKLRLPVPEAEDELRLLSETINGMLERMERAFERQSQFTADASHELRTPLSVINGYIDLLARWGTHEPEAMDKAVRAISRQTRYMNHLVENLLFLSRGESETLAINPSAFPLEELLLELREELALVDGEHAYKLDTPMITLSADRAMVRQMLLALLDNARKYTPAGGEIAMTAYAREGEVHISVSDTGVGIPEEDVPHVFERFYRVDKSRSRAMGGSGLGLSIVRMICAMHGGRIWIESRVGQGTKVTMALPAGTGTRTGQEFRRCGVDRGLCPLDTHQEPEVPGPPTTLRRDGEEAR